jgi:hypothetical protein
MASANLLAQYRDQRPSEQARAHTSLPYKFIENYFVAGILVE